jgi:hypothetical protein
LISSSAQFNSITLLGENWFDLWYNEAINNSLSIQELVKTLRVKGGRINKYYLQDWNKNKHAIVFLHGWFGGKNIREAIMKALS